MQLTNLNVLLIESLYISHVETSEAVSALLHCYPENLQECFPTKMKHFKEAWPKRGGYHDKFKTVNSPPLIKMIQRPGIKNV